MNEQDQLNQFLIDFAEFLAKYYSDAFDSIDTKWKDSYVIVTIYGSKESLLEISSDGSEITIMFSESHWHIGSFRGLEINSICSNTVRDVFDVLDGKMGTCSYWDGDTPLGGATFYLTDDVSAISKELLKRHDLIKLKMWGDELVVHKADLTC